MNVLIDSRAASRWTIHDESCPVVKRHKGNKAPATQDEIDDLIERKYEVLRCKCVKE